MNLYLGTDDGLAVFEGQEEAWRPRYVRLEGQQVTAVAARGKTLWVGTTSGLWRSLDEGASWSRTNPEPHEPHVRAMDADADSSDLLLVGMGMPRQEQWLLAHLADLDVAVATHAGATLDFFAGSQAKPPPWVSNMGLAWLYRLAHDPRRLWRRYLLEPWALVLPTLRLWRAR